jgi:hypothetical protein
VNINRILLLAALAAFVLLALFPAEGPVWP